MSEYLKSFLDHLKKQKELLDRQLELVEQVIKIKNLASATYELLDEKEKAAYSGAMEEINKPNQSLTYEIRRVLIREGVYLTPTQIRDRLVRSGYNFARYQSNPLVSIHSTLNRLMDELEIVTLEEGAKAYRFRRAVDRKKDSAATLGKVKNVPAART